MSNEAVIITFPTRRAGCEHDVPGTNRLRHMGEPCSACEGVDKWMEWLLND